MFCYAGRVCQAWSTGIPFPALHQGSWSLCKSANQSRQLQNRSTHRHSTRHHLGRIWAGKAEALMFLSYTHWPQRSASYGRGDTLKVSHHTPPAQTLRTQTALPPHLLSALIFPVTKLRDVHACLINNQLTSFHIFMQ